MLRARSAKGILESASTEVSWIVEPLLAEGSIMQLYGRQGKGKSSLLVQLAHSLHTGEPWLGFQIHQPGPCLLLQLDMAEVEMELLLRRADDAGLSLDSLWISDWSAGFSIRSNASRKRLREWCNKNEPRVVICDTIMDAVDGRVDGNEDVRRILRWFQQSVSPAAFIFVNHERKKSGYMQMHEQRTGEEIDDEDAFTGFGAWEQVASTSIQLTGTSPAYQIRFRKTRIAKLGFTSLAVPKNPFGFFEPHLNHAQMLLQWPSFLSREERLAATGRCSSISKVYRDVAERSGSSFGAVKKMAQRIESRGGILPWKEKF